MFRYFLKGLREHYDNATWVSAFILLLVLIPLPFGSNRPLFSDLFAVMTGVLLLVMLWAQHKTSGPAIAGTPPVKRLYFSAMGLTLVAIWTFFQVVPWTPESWHHPIWQEAARVLGPMSGSISVDPGVFPESLIRLISYIACFLIAFTAAQDAGQAKKIVRALAYAGVAYALYGLLVESTGADSVLWYKKWAYNGFLTSTFVNKNSYAVYAGLGLLCCLVMAWQHFKNFQPHDPVLAKKSRSVALLASLGTKEYLIILMPLIVLAALSLTGSRAGVASSIIGVVAFMIAMAINRRAGARKWMGLAAVCFVVFVAFVGLGGGALLVRIDATQLDSDATTRLSAYNLERMAIGDNPWLGFGLGTFDNAFKLYRDSSLSLWFHHAHNDYLEMIMDLGVPVALLLFSSILLLVSCCLTGVWGRRKNAVYPALAVGASAIVGVHALVDFSLHIPAIAATYAALLGIGVGQSWSSRSQDAPDFKQSHAPKKSVRKHGVKHR